MRLDLSPHGVMVDGKHHLLGHRHYLGTDRQHFIQIHDTEAGYLVLLRSGKKVISRTIIPDHFVYAIDSVGIGPLEPPVEFAYEHFAHWAHSSRIILHAQAGQPWQFFTGASEPNVITDGQIARIGADPRADHRHWVPNYQITGATYAIVIVIMGERVLRRELHLGPGVNEDHLSTIRWGLIDTTHLLLAPQP
jgi:hypothetical protein